jgi:uncharacterized protein
VKIVLDTNILISAVITQGSTIQAVLDVCRTGKVTLVLSKPLLREIGRVLHKPKILKRHCMSDKQISQYIEDLATFAEVVPGTAFVEISKDPTDNMFFACAIEASANYIVSGDKGHILSIPSYQGVETISATNFVEKILKRIHAKVA